MEQENKLKRLSACESFFFRQPLPFVDTNVSRRRRVRKSNISRAIVAKSERDLQPEHVSSLVSCVGSLNNYWGAIDF
jgi:hypothetical protein